MSITKNTLKSKPICKVTFSFTPENDSEVVLIGDFNDWNPKENPLKKLKNGMYKGTLNLETGKEYEFKYVVDGNFLNDPEADSYRFNEFAGVENSVISL